MITMSEKVKILCRRRNMTIAQLAELLGSSRQNLSNKFARDNFTEKDLRDIAEKLNAEFIGEFRLNDTKEII